MFKRLTALLLSLAILLTGCSKPSSNPQTPDNSGESEGSAGELSFSSLSDPDLLVYMEDSIYQETVAALNNEDYFVENVSAVYISKEYLEEVAYNSQSNVYFGCTLDELNEVFQGRKYVFTLGEDGTTTTKELQEITTDITGDMMKDVAIGAGVILVCVTVSTLTVTAAPAVSVIFAMSATEAVKCAASGAVIGAVSAAIAEAKDSGDFEKALIAAGQGATEGFKWGAVSGAISGAAQGTVKYAKIWKNLKGAELNGLTMREAAAIQMQSGYPLDVVKQFHSKQEYLVYGDAGLKAIPVNGKTALVQNIDLNYTSTLADGTKVTNLERMKRGYAAIDPATGKAYQLHHVGQKADGTLAVLTTEQHQGNAAILNIFGKDSEINRPEFSTTRKNFWMYLGNVVFANGAI